MSTGGNQTNTQQARNRTARVIASLTLPHDRDAEIATIGCLMLNPNLIDELQLRDDDFWHTDTKTLFSRICRIDADIGAERIDPGTLLHELRRHNEMELVGGAAKLADTLQAAPAGTALARYYAQTLKNQAAERCLLNAANEVYQITQDESLETTEKIERAEHAIFEVQARTDENGQQQTMRSLSNAVEAVLAEITARNNTNYRIEIPTGLAIDTATGGLRRKEVHVVAARPGVGKTSFAMQVAMNAVNGGADALFISLEMSYTELIERLIANLSTVSLTQIRNGNIGEDGMTRVHTGAHNARELPITIEDRATLDILGVASSARRWARRNAASSRPKLIVIDYLQLIKPERIKGRERTRQEEVSEMSRRVKGLARELDVAILLLAQLNRQSAEANRAPKLHDLRESGAIEQDADLVSFLWKPPAAENQSFGSAERVQLILEKNRNGPRGNYDLNFMGRFCRFTDAANEQQEAAAGSQATNTPDAATRAAGDTREPEDPGTSLFDPYGNQDEIPD